MISYEGIVARLRPLQKEDFRKSVIWRNNPNIRENSIGYRLPVTDLMEERWIDSAMDDQSKNRIVFAIESLADNNLIGLTHLNQIDWISRVCKFGITIGEEKYHGLGMATDSMLTLFNYAFQCLNLRKICLEVASFNAKAQRLYKNFGFTEEGTLKNHLFLNGKYHDITLMAIFHKEFCNRYCEQNGQIRREC